jgi:hypothetical protein
MLEGLKVPFSKFILAVKLFILEVHVKIKHIKSLVWHIILTIKSIQKSGNIYTDLFQKMTSC